MPGSRRADSECQRGCAVSVRMVRVHARDDGDGDEEEEEGEPGSRALLIRGLHPHDESLMLMSSMWVLLMGSDDEHDVGSD